KHSIICIITYEKMFVALLILMEAPLFWLHI
ncbi:hypothetical protein, partial [Plasmodium yoelii yoelii]